MPPPHMQPASARVALAFLSHPRHETRRQTRLVAMRLPRGVLAPSKAPTSRSWHRTSAGTAKACRGEHSRPKCETTVRRERPAPLLAVPRM